MILGTLYDHGGYQFPGFPSSILWHDAHHKYFNQNYGPFGVLDYLHNTGVWPDGYWQTKVKNYFVSKL